jgi:putative transposase
LKRESVNEETDMRKSRFTEEKIIVVLTGQERGTGTAEVCRKHGISPTTFYKWRAKFGGMGVSEAHKLKTLETEDGRLKNPCSITPS